MKILQAIRSRFYFFNASIVRKFEGKYTFHCEASLSIKTNRGSLSSKVPIQYFYRLKKQLRPVWNGNDPNFTQTKSPIFLEICKGKYLVGLTEFLPTPERVFFPGRSMLDVCENMAALRLTQRLSMSDYPVLVAMMEVNGKLLIQRVAPDELEQVFQQPITIEYIDISIQPKLMPVRRNVSLQPNGQIDFQTLLTST